MYTPWPSVGPYIVNFNSFWPVIMSITDIYLYIFKGWLLELLTVIASINLPLISISNDLSVPMINGEIH